MSTFIEELKAKEAQKRTFHEAEDRFIESEIERIKSEIASAISRGLNEYWYIDSLSWCYDDYLNTSRSSSGGYSKGFQAELSEYKNEDSKACILSHYVVNDYNYIKSELTTKLKELGCKEIYILIGPVDITVEKTYKKSFFAKHEYQNLTRIKYAVRVVW